MPVLQYRFRFPPNAKLEYISPEIEQITGYQPREFYDDPLLGIRIVLEQDRPFAWRYFQGEGKWDEPLVVRWRHRDGRIVATVQTFTTIEKKGHVVGLEATVNVFGPVDPGVRV